MLMTVLAPSGQEKILVLPTGADYKKYLGRGDKLVGLCPRPCWYHASPCKSGSAAVLRHTAGIRPN